MTVIDRMKEEQHEEEVDKLSALITAKLSAVWLELDLAKRNVRLSNDESTRILMTSFYAFAADLAVEEGHVREDFIKMMGEMFDDALAEIASEEEEEAEDESDKGSTDGGTVRPIVVS